MRISTKRSAIALLAGLGFLCIRANAQGTDYSKIQIKTTKITNNFYALDGAGGTIGILTGPDGVFMVDSQFAPLSGKIVAAIRQITDKPIRFMVNTHFHPDHTGGNENLGKMGVTIISRAGCCVTASPIRRREQTALRARPRLLLPCPSLRIPDG